MNGFERLKEQMEGQEDLALIQTVNYLLTRKDMQDKYLNEEKTIKGMCDFIQSKGRKQMTNGWRYVPDEVVYSWAIMYFTFPNEYLKIKNDTKSKKSESTNKKEESNNIITIEKAKEQVEKKDKINQLSLFGNLGGGSDDKK